MRQFEEEINNVVNKERIRKQLLLEREAKRFIYNQNKRFVDSMIKKFKLLLPQGSLKHPDCVILRIACDKQLKGNHFPQWKITTQDIDRIWNKINEKEYPNEIGSIIYGKISRQAKLETIKFYQSRIQNWQ